LQFSRKKLVIVLSIIIVVEGAFIIQLVLSNNYLNSSYEELSGEYNALLNLYGGLNTSFEDLQASYWALQSQYLGQYGNVTVEQALNLIDTNPNLIIVDVRTSQEYVSGHIAGALNLPENLTDHLSPADEILVYCKSGVRSAAAQQLLNANGYEKVYNMLGGIDAWINAGYPVIEG
jgi:rhodanese-related sulfurtransferase